MTADKKAKILATLGPATRSRDDIRALVEAGANLFRLNFSHGDYADHAQRFAWVREVEAELNYPIGVLMDLQGPKLRVGRFAAGAVQLQRGQTFTLDLSDAPGDERRVNLPHPEIIHALEPGMSLLLDDGKIRLEVVNCHSDAIETRVTVGGELSDRKGVNVPEAVLQLSPLTDKDRRDLAFGLELGVDWVALSFVQRPEDIDEARGLIGDKAFLMAKIEKPSAVSAIEAIAERADAIMVARGDLGVEVPAESVPGIQKRIVQVCRQLGKPVVVATQMLESMRFSPAPTRAEVTDVATAVGAGADAVMLSAETASGQYPREAVEMMAKIVRQVEAEPDYHVQLEVNRPQPDATVSDAISCAIRRVSRILPVAVLVNYTESGNSTLRAARERPKAPILSLTPNLRTARRLTVAWGVYSVVNEQLAHVDEICSTALDIALAQRMARRGDTVVVTAGVPFGRPRLDQHAAHRDRGAAAGRSLKQRVRSGSRRPPGHAGRATLVSLGWMGPEIRGRVSIHPGKTFLSDHGLPRALPCRPWTFKASGSTPAGGLFFFLERPACMTLAWPSRPGCVASAPDPTMTAPAPRAGLASPCLPSGPCRTDRHAPCNLSSMHPESSCAASARCSSRATHAWAWPVCWRSPSARRRCSPAPSLAAPSARCWRACCTAPTATSRPGCTATTPC